MDLGLGAAGCGRHGDFSGGRVVGLHGWGEGLGTWLNAHLALSLLLLVSGLPAESILPDPGPGLPEGASAG